MYKTHTIRLVTRSSDEDATSIVNSILDAFAQAELMGGPAAVLEQETTDSTEQEINIYQEQCDFDPQD